MEQITNKRYYKISEVAEIINVAASTLRVWETQFHILKPKRNDRGTRFYTPADLENARMIKYLVHDKGLKIEAALEQIRVNKDGVSRKAEALNRLSDVRNRLQDLIDSLHKLR